jgi:hypothetical protein
MIGPSPRRVTVILACSAACAAENKTDKEYKSRARDFVVFIIVWSLAVGFKRANSTIQRKEITVFGFGS